MTRVLHVAAQTENTADADKLYYASCFFCCCCWSEHRRSVTKAPSQVRTHMIGFQFNASRYRGYLKWKVRQETETKKNASNSSFSTTPLRLCIYVLTAQFWQRAPDATCISHHFPFFSCTFAPNRWVHVQMMQDESWSWTEHSNRECKGKKRHLINTHHHHGELMRMSDGEAATRRRYINHLIFFLNFINVHIYFCCSKVWKQCAVQKHIPWSMCQQIAQRRAEEEEEKKWT